MRLEIRRIQRLAGRLPQQGIEAQQAALAVHLGTQPAEQRRQVASAERRIQARHVAPRRRHQLRRRHRAQRVAGEIAECAVIPVDVLQAAARIVRRRDAEQRAESLVPGARQIGHRKRAGDQRLLQPEAQDDMRGIGHLVGIDADEAALDAPPQPREILRPIGRRIAAEGRVQLPARAMSGTRPTGRPASRR